MKLSDALDAFYAHSEKASESLRALAVGGVGIAWLFRGQDGAPIARELVCALVIFASALALDLLQYVVAATIWGIYHRYKETRLADDATEEFRAPVAFAVVINVLFALKILMLVPGYVVLVRFLATKI